MVQSGNEHILQSQLREYAARNLYPLHMPGHKRRVSPAPGLPYEWDVTEVPGTDDLHDAQGILREAMERTAALWGADRTWYLVNGSTCGLLAGIRALAAPGSEVLCARNCHKAVYHALALAGYRVRWILPPVDEEWGICGGIRAEQIETALVWYPSVRAVILTSPTYEGILSEVEEICRACHKKRIPVLIDEAHGAHLLPMSENAGFPKGALACGADVVIQSPHKTLPSLTQTAFLHLQGGLVDPVRIEEELDIFETSSPSYPLLASLDGCTGLLREQGGEMFEQWGLRIGRFASRVRSLQRIRVLHCGGNGSAGSRDCLSRSDPGKILIDTRHTGMTGPAFAAVLRESWHLETEMAQGTLLLAMTSPCDSEDALDRLAEALLEIDRKLCHEAPPSRTQSVSCEAAGIYPTAACTIAEAAGQTYEEVPLNRSAGRICAEYLYFYPPGIPILAPGEVITRDHLRLLERAGEEEMALYRHSDPERIRCLRE